MSRNAWIAGVAVLAAGIGGFYWYAGTQKTSIPVEEVLAPPAPAGDSAPATTDEAKVEYPLPVEAQAEHPLPPLAASDSQILAALESLFGKSLASMLIPDQLIRRFVTTVNSLDSEEAVPLRQRPLRHTPGLLVVEQRNDRLYLSPQNAKRYTPLVTLLQAADVERVVDAYVRFYPLLQKAYAELGYPDRYFNDRVIQVIDHLLETSEVAGSIELVRPKVFYEFADRDLEKRSSGEKILIRIGADNAEIVRRKLRALREELVARSLKP